MSFFQSLILGIVQGLTEFLPISSSAHLVLVPYLLNWNFPTEQIFPFDVLVQLGTLAAVILYFWKDIVSILKSFFSGLVNKTPFEDPQARLGWFLILATIPAVFSGLLLQSKVEAAFSSPRITAIFLLVTAVILLIADWLGKRTRQLDEMTWWDALWIGLFQAISIFPGISRSGSTISGGLTRHFDRTSSTRFSFLMSIPVMIGAGIVSLKDLNKVPNLGSFLPILAVGFLAAAVVGYLSIHWLLSFIKRQNFWYFSIYCIIAASCVLIVGAARGNTVSSMSSPEVASPQAAVSATESGFQVIRLEYSDSLEWMEPAMSSCANLIPNTGLVTHQLPTNQLAFQQADLILRWGVPTNMTQSSFELGKESLVIAVNAQNPLQSLTSNEVQQIFSGEIATWGDFQKSCPSCFANALDSALQSSPIALNFYAAGEDIQNIFLSQLMAGRPAAVNSGIIVPDPAAMAQTLQRNVNAVGFLPAHQLDSSLRAVKITDLNPADLNQPILAITSESVNNHALEWLGCVQKVINP